MAKFLAMILAGGEGRRLDPLTRERAKPAVPFGGRYRIVDFVLSNFANSGILRMKVLVQYKSESLNTHVQRAWRLTALLNQYVELVPAQMRVGPKWFEGSADAIYQNLNIITDEEPEYTFVFGADHVYRMDVRQMLDFHQERKAELTVAAIPIPMEEASDFGIIEVDAEGRMIGFTEKPKADPKTIPGDPTRCLASMGNYLFTTDVARAGDRARRRRSGQRPRLREVDRRLDVAAQARLRLRLREERGARAERARARLLARRRLHRRLLPGEHGPRRRGPDLLALQRPVADLHGRSTTTRPPSSCSATSGSTGSAAPPTRSCRRVASSPAARSTTRSCHPRCG